MHNNKNKIKTSLLSLLLIISLLFVPLTGCGTTEPDDTSSSISSESDSESESASDTSSEIESESEKGSEIESETSSESQKESETESQKESEKESEKEQETESEKQPNSETPDKKPEKDSEKEPEKQPSSETPDKTPSNSESNDTPSVNDTPSNNETPNNSESGSQAGENDTKQDFSKPGISLSEIPAYSTEYYIPLNNNTPHFSTTNLPTESFEFYSELDSLGRCGVAYACLGQDLMPTGDRGSISSVKPTGWHTTSYSCVPGSSLYNRSHLIAWSLAGENANKQNLITGTEHLNQKEMTKFEDMVRDYIKETGNHVMYRVTPFYDGNNLVATGVQMEAWSIEDDGADICFNVFIYNVQDGIHIDYATGESYEINPPAQDTESDSSGSNDAKFIVNGKSGKGQIHTSECSNPPTAKPIYCETFEEALEKSKEVAPNRADEDRCKCSCMSEYQ